MKNVITVAGILILAAAVQADLSWGQIGFGAGQSMDPRAALKEASASEAPAAGAPRIILAGYVAGDDPSAGQPGVPVEWVSINGGKFTMGTDDGSDLFKAAKPIHQVAIKTFDMSKTLVTVEQYAECVIKGGCMEPGTGEYCNWGVAGRQRHPINCVDWNQANQYAKFKGARLPSEAEYEYAATSGGKNQKYPWGNDDATSDKAVMSGDSTMPVCSKPAGNTSQGLCDMVGNVWELVEDVYQSSYVGAPTDGSAFEGAGSLRVVRGGSFFSSFAGYLRADRRSGVDPGNRDGDIGFRLARSSR
jgi:iron(II)-dependent oxidoreductase